MKNLVIIVIIAVLVVAGAWWYLNRMPGTNLAMNRLAVNLSTQNASGQSGTAMLEEITEETEGVAKKIVRLTIKLSGSTSDLAQPAHIHLGSCAALGQAVFPLTLVTNGVSVTDIDTTLDQIKASSQPLAINVHKSEAEIGTYVACGDIPLSASTTQ